MAATANIKAGKAYVEVTAETSRFRKNLAGAQAELRAFGKKCGVICRNDVVVTRGNADCFYGRNWSL